MNSIGTISSPWAIETGGLTKTFNNRPALDGIDLTVGRGESVVVFGANGAGKTTLIKTLAGIMNPSSGRILIDGLDLKEDAGEARRRTGVVTHQTFLYTGLTVYENLKFYCRMFDVSGQDERIKELAHKLDIINILYDRVSSLSRGMQQRVSIARSLLHEPPIILLDEPETGLDRQSVSNLHSVLRKEGNQERTIVLTSHNLERGLEMGDRVLIIDRGRIVYEAAVSSLDLAGLKDVYEHYTGVVK